MRNINQKTHSPLHASSSSSLLRSNDLGCHLEFWFDNGNIALITTQDTSFRICYGYLVARSTVFADVFASARSVAHDTLKGPLVVHLTNFRNNLAHRLRIPSPTSMTWYVFHLIHPTSFSSISMISSVMVIPT